MTTKKIATFLKSLEKLPAEVIAEFPDGQEFPIQKIYFVNGRQPTIKILVDCEGEENNLRDKIEELENEITNYEKEEKGLKKDLTKWEDAFGSDPDSFATLWDEVETAITGFARVAKFKLGSNDGNNIAMLCEKYEDLLNEREESNEIIGELKLENISLTREIQNLKNQLASFEEQAKLHHD